MADRNQDELNAISRKTLPDILDAGLRGSNRACYEAARPTADLVLPTLSEHTLGQLMQMLMLATVVEGRLMGVNPYGQPAVEAHQGKVRALLKG
jgi:glucose-6-phosphate isomerase